MKFGKTKITAVFGILVLSVLAGLLIRIFPKESRQKSEQVTVSAKSEESTLKKLGKLDIPTLPLPQPDLKYISKEKSLIAAAPFFENINKAVKSAEKLLATGDAPVQNVSTTTSNGIILSLTEDQFHFLYPDKFLASLADAQNLFISQYDPGYKPILKIKTDGEVRFIEEKIVSTLLSAGMIDKDKANQFVTTIRFTLPELQIIDLQKRGSYDFNPLPFSKFINNALEIKPPQSAPKGLFLADLMEKLANALANKAQAACGYCYPQVLCFQEGAFAKMPGTEEFKASCYCTGCLKSLGCLSSHDGEAAIYDETTGICGSGLRPQTESGGVERAPY